MAKIIATVKGVEPFQLPPEGTFGAHLIVEEETDKGFLFHYVKVSKGEANLLLREFFSTDETGECEDEEGT